ncbi:TIGR02186 family protein [Stappia stellulata]|uniref:TIGR02186 family protein n=1 Tax=Stappia stellulata TaxID=71235 RepID=UPI000422F6AB|nr:TIGR02186 family protein [Stappia stellulata]
MRRTTLRTLAACGLAALALTTAALAPARAENLISALSNDRVNIESNFTGTKIVVFGEIARDALTVARPDPYDLAVVVSGPEQVVTTRRKGRFLGIWVNRDAETFESVPSFLAIHTTRAPHEMASRTVLQRHRIGLRNLNLPIAIASDVPIGDRDNFRAAFLRLRVESGLYREETQSIEFLSNSLFRTSVTLPANVPVGDYTVSTYLLRGGVLLAQAEEQLTIAKSGFEQFTYRLAYEYSALYGLLAVGLAIFTGWLAGVIFRRD